MTLKRHPYFWLLWNLISGISMHKEKQSESAFPQYDQNGHKVSRNTKRNNGFVFSFWNILSPTLYVKSCIVWCQHFHIFWSFAVYTMVKPWLHWGLTCIMLQWTNRIYGDRKILTWESNTLVPTGGTGLWSLTGGSEGWEHFARWSVHWMVVCIKARVASLLFEPRHELSNNLTF